MAVSNMKNPPVFKEDDYEQWKKDIDLWSVLTDLAKAKQAISIHLSLSGRARKATSELTKAELNSDNGVKTLLDKLDRVFLQDENWRCFNAYLAFENCRRDSDTSIDEFLSEFDQRNFKLKSCGVNLPEPVLACRLLKSSNLSDVHFQLALSTTTAMTFEEMRKTLKRLFTDSGIVTMPKTDGHSGELSQNIKVEPVMLSEGYRHKPGNRIRRPLGGRGGFSNSSRGHQRGRRNPVGYDGRVLKCFNCNSDTHWARECPYATDRNTLFSHDIRGNKIDDDEEEVQITLMASDNEFDDKIDVLFGETMGAMILDLGCSKTVCGVGWFEVFLETLNEIERKKVLYEKSTSFFKFGDGKRMPSNKRAVIPCVLGGKNIRIRTDIVDCNIPLLLSKASMKKAGMVIDTNTDTVRVFGKEVKLSTTSIGHYKLSIVQPPCGAKIEYILLNIDTGNPDAIASKLHRQFAHPSAERLKKLLKDARRDDKLLKDSVDKVTKACDICIRYKRPRPRPVVTLPLATTFNETVAMDLKKWHDDHFLVMVDLASRFCTAVVISNKSAETVVTAIFKAWITIFGAPRNFLSDNGGEFNNEIMRCLGDHFGIKLMCTAAESPWSNGVCERMNFLLGISVQRIMSNTKCNVQVALSWAVAARNALQNYNGFSPNQLVFGRNPAIPNVLECEPPALETVTSSMIVADNLNAMNAAWQGHVENDSNARLKRALLNQVREDNVAELKNGDSVFYKRQGEDRWRGPGNVIGRDGKQVLVRHGGIYVRVHSCRLQRSYSQPTDNLQAPQEDANSAVCDRMRITSVDDDDDVDVYEDNADVDNVDENVSGDTCANENSDICNNTGTYFSPSKDMPAVKAGSRIEYVNQDGKSNIVKIVNRAGKVGGKYNHCYNIQNPQGGGECIDLLRDVQKWRHISDNEEILSCSSGDRVYQAKLAEHDNWIANDVYDKVKDSGQTTVSLRWVTTEKMKNTIPHVKARLVARGFEEDLLNRTDSPTCSKDSLMLALALIVSFGWQCHSIDVKSAFLQGNKIERDLFVKPPKEFDDGCLWKLKKNVYGLNDAARAWYSRLKEVLLGLGMQISRLDPALFFWRRKNVLSGIMCVHVDDILWAGTPEFFTTIVEAMKEKLTIGTSNDGKSFKYIGVNIVQKNGVLGLHQNDYVDSLEEIDLTQARASRRLDHLGKRELQDYRALVGQLNWLGTQTRPDVAFDVCELSTVLNVATVDDVLRANKVVKKVKQRRVTLQFRSLDCTDGYTLECYSDASFGNLPGGGSQGGYVIFLVDSHGMRCPLSWQSKKVRRVVKSTLAAETLALLDAAEEGIYIANLLSEIVGLVSPPIVKCFVDNRSLVESLYSTKRVEDKLLRIHMAVLNDLLERKELASVTWVQSARQIANALTKRGASVNLLLSAIAEAQQGH